MKKLVLLFFAVSLLSIMRAQSVSGTVTDNDGNPLVGANIEIVGTGQGSSSDGSGNYMITDVASGDVTVKASYIGYKTQTKHLKLDLVVLTLIFL